MRRFKYTVGEPIVQKRVKRQYSEMEARIKSKLNKFKGILTTKDFSNVDPDDLYDVREEYIKARQTGIEFSRASIVVNQEFNYNILNVPHEFSTENLNVQLVAEKLGKKYADATVESRKKELYRLVQQAHIEGHSIDTFEETLGKYFQPLRGKKAWKARRIARTETSRNFDRATKTSLEVLNIQKCDVVGCEDNHGDCNATNVPVGMIEHLDLHPNHTGSVVPQI